MVRGNFSYFFIFLVFILTFSFIAVNFIINFFSSLELILFSLFIIIAMLILIGTGEDDKNYWFLAIILFAFLINYLFFLFLTSKTITIFILIIVNIIAFIISLFAIGNAKSRSKPVEEDRTKKLKEKLSEIIQEERAKFIYSERGKIYHKKECPVAKRIKNKKFIDKEQAKNLKLKKHNCVTL